MRPFGWIGPATLAIAALAACSGGGRGASPLPNAPSASGNAAAIPIPASSKIQHVIVVVLENRSFDDLFADDAALASVTDPPVDVDSAKTGVSAGKPVAFTAASLSDSTFDEDHSHQGFLKEFDGGLDDGWAATAYAYVPHGEVQPYYDMASQFAIGDRFFHGITAPTFPSHLEIGAASTFGIIDNPSDTAWGCDSKPGTTTGLYDPAAPGEEDKAAGPFPCFDALSIFDLLDRKSVSWKYYVAPEGQDITGELNIAAYFRHIRYGPDWNANIAASDAQILIDLTTGGLSSVNFVIPNDTSTDHAGTPSLGPTYIETLVNAFGESRYFDNTLMIVTWDDWGGWYDHVSPPKRADGSQLSFRKPILFLGGYVKRNYASHVQTEDASIAKTIEKVYGLDTLGQNDVAANGFDDVLDLTTPPKAFIPITSQQGMTVTAGPIPPTTLGGIARRASGFRVVPGDFLRYLGDGRYYSTKNDYYGERSADY